MGKAAGRSEAQGDTMIHGGRNRPWGSRPRLPDVVPLGP